MQVFLLVNYLTTSICPFLAAKCKGYNPVSVGTSTLHPKAHSTLTTSESPKALAI